MQAYHKDVLWECHYAWTHRQAYYSLHLGNNQAAVPNFYDVFLKEELPGSKENIIPNYNRISKKVATILCI